MWWSPLKESPSLYEAVHHCVQSTGRVNGWAPYSFNESFDSKETCGSSRLDALAHEWSFCSTSPKLLVLIVRGLARDWCCQAASVVNVWAEWLTEGGDNYQYVAYCTKFNTSRESIQLNAHGVPLVLLVSRKGIWDARHICGTHDNAKIEVESLSNLLLSVRSLCLYELVSGGKK